MNLPDDDRLTAAIELIGRTGAADLKVGYLDDDVPEELARWWAKARYGGQIVTVENQASAGDVAEKLAWQLLEGGLCVHCMRTISCAADTTEEQCQWVRQNARWRRGCETEFPDTEIIPTKRKLAVALLRAGCSRLMVQAALEGYYCADVATEILTKRGWLTWDKLEPGDETLAIELDSDTCRWDPVRAVHSFQYDGPMVSIESRCHSSLTTPSHRWLIRSGCGRVGRRADRPLRWVTSSELNTCSRVPTILPRSDAPVHQKYEDDFVELAAWFWTEGTFSDRAVTIPCLSNRAVDLGSPWQGCDTADTANPDGDESLEWHWLDRPDTYGPCGGGVV